MPSYKDEKTNTWYCKFYYTDWQGHKKQKLKRGFTRQKDAKEWESTASSRFSMTELHILPFFKDKVISDIEPVDIAAWQNEMLQKGLSETYLNQINIYLKAIFAYAVDYVG